MDIKKFNTIIGLVTLSVTSFAKPVLLPEFANGGVNADAIW